MFKKGNSFFVLAMQCVSEHTHVNLASVDRPIHLH